MATLEKIRSKAGLLVLVVEPESMPMWTGLA